MQNQSFKYDVFLSHSSKDKPIVLELAKRLRDDGLKVWLDDWMIKPGDSIPLKIEEGLKDSRVLILCMSQNAFDSEWVSLERHTMLFRDPGNKERRFIPILLTDCKIPFLLKQYSYLDWSDKSKIGYHKLLDALIISEKKEVEKIKGNYLLTTLKGHTSSVYKCAISPDGKNIVSSSYDNTIKIWELATGRNLATLEGHTDDVLGCAISPDGKNIVSGSYDNTIKIWELATGKNLATLEGHTKYVHGCSISPDGKKIVSCSGDSTIKIWELATGRNLATLEGHAQYVLGCTISPDGKKIVSCSGDSTIKIWELATGRNLATLEGHTSAVMDCVISPDGKK
ncbi:MAG: TIR domain-containing protein [Bacteroidota bacterium]